MDPLTLSSLSNEDLPFLGVVARRGVSQIRVKIYFFKLYLVS